LIKFIFIIGLEGSGHKMLREVMKPLWDKNNFYDQPSEIFFFMRDFYKSDKIKYEKYKFKFQEFINKKKNSIIYLSPSYPFGRTERFKNIPNLNEAIYWVNSNYKKSIEIKIIHLDRSIQESALSALNRGYSNSSKQACNHIYNSAIILDKQINNIKEKFKILKLDYNSFVKNPKKNCLRLSKYLNINEKYFSQKMVLTKHKRLSPHRDISIVKNFFQNKKFYNIQNKFDNSSLKSKIFIYHHMGLGDFISCNSIIRRFCKQNKEVFLFCKKNLYENIKFMYRDLHNLYLIIVKTENDIDYFFKKIKLEKKNYQVVKLGFDNFYKTISKCFKKKDFTTDMVFYKQLNIPYTDRFTKTFWKRDLVNERRVYKKLNPKNKKYIFIHDDPDRNLEIENYVKVKKGIKIIKNDNTEIIFYLGLLLERAQEIHLIESSIRHLIETLKIKNNKIYLYNIRENLSRGPFKNIDGKYVGTNRNLKIINSVKYDKKKNWTLELKKNLYRKLSRLFNINEKQFVTFKSFD
tara:strand:+ start:1094 stop:2653 length:1560 start_codon:yes stop_codon:yes gene_type:complete